MVALLIPTLAGAGAARADLATGLVGFWKLDETAIGGATAAGDSSGMGHPGVYVNTPISSTTVAPVMYADPRSAALTRATQQAVRIANMPAALKPAALTVSVWYRSTSVDVGRSEIVSGGDNYTIYLETGSLQAGRRSATGWPRAVASLANNLDGAWHHAAATFDASAVTLYFDGVQKAATATATDGPIVYDQGTDLWFGRYGGPVAGRSWNFEGNIDEVSLYDRVLTAAEIAQLAAGARPGSVTMAMDAGSGGNGGTDGGVDRVADAPVEAPPIVDDGGSAGGAGGAGGMKGLDAAPDVAPAGGSGGTASGAGGTGGSAGEAGSGGTTTAGGGASGTGAGGTTTLPLHRLRDASGCALAGQPAPAGAPALLLLALLGLVSAARGRRPR